MNATALKDTARLLYLAETEKREVERITKDYPELTVEEAYAIQEELIQLKLWDGNGIIGPKMGLTSRAKMEQMNVEEPIYGYIFEDMIVPNGGSIRMNELIHPKVEAEIAFVLGKDIEGPGVTKEKVLEAVAELIPVLEVIDSRYENFSFTLPDVIADNASSSRVVLGEKVKMPDHFKLDEAKVSLVINGEVKEQGTGAAVVGHPANSAAMLANMLSRKKQKLAAGSIILTGGVTGAVMLQPGDRVSAQVEGLGDVSFSVQS
ncbi:2-hydroxyhexa-2,4-dienoate hydratase [Bacillus paralicheniformis]|uniref:2-hydroxyhexa-2,4-dienoate hydratase n=1 Tax=Bacillus paralicheniformis TaxID=1648923 RepID=A0A6I7U6M3_9BACI|nr:MULTISPECIES: fumarylacetoacetate hydrolase family protein [Bacillus]ETB70377.1 4-oxalocrotonate decarboxylase [Bacillus sp. CPSM8]MBC8621735.1 fumarylacetoacetate hydrolase family protein [Robertmurraya crescens]AJO20409.1 4-oxalocrotonate decarboxylase [Bacillus paralicheniformis]ARA87591.1 4-oxalocrotonate decarboxylase [Bacillus paralicheniformis]KFM84746.1 fumarylacetoacetate (FAA) hydrolase family protein [Bacillus paralicheniformis]